MIGKKELQRCRRTRRQSDRLCFRKDIRNTHVHTPCLTNYYLNACLRAPPSERLPVSLHTNGNLLNNFRPIWVIQPPAQKYSALHRPQISGYFRAVPSRQEGRIARRHERGTGCGGRRQRQARSVFAGRLSVSGHGAQDDRRCGVRQNRVVLASVADVKLPVANWIQPDRSAIKPAAMEAKGIRLQGELGISRQTIAQGMPACSGCTCMLVCASHYILHTRPRVQQAPGIPCSLSLEGQG